MAICGVLLVVLMMRIIGLLIKNTPCLKRKYRPFIFTFDIIVQVKDIRVKGAQ